MSVTRDVMGAVTFTSPSATSPGNGFEYKVDSGSWTTVSGSTATTLSASDSPVVVRLRETTASLAGGDVSALTVPRPAAPSGVAMVGSRLTAPTISGKTVTYQWYADGQAISGATASKYVAKADDQGKKISVELSYSETTGTAVSGATATVTSSVTVSSLQTEPIAPFSPTSLVAPSGTPVIGQTLSAPPHATTATDVTYSYQWTATPNGGVATNVGTNATTYTIGDGDAGKTIRVAVTYKAADTTTIATVTSDPTTPVLPGVPTFSGTAQVGAQLTAAPLASVPGAASYRWQTWDAASGGNASDLGDCFTTPLTRVLTSAEQEKYIALVAFSGASCTGSFNTSTRSTRVAAFAPTSISAPSGDAKVGGRLSVPADATTSVPGVSRTFRWMATTSGGVTSTIGANSSSYLLTEDELGDRISLEVTYKAIDDSVITTLVSPPTDVVEGFTPASIAAPSGTAMEGSQLTVSAASSVTGVTPSYEWLADGQPGAGTVGADPSTYVVGALDTGKKISVRVTYRNGADVVATRTSAETLPVMAFAPTTIAAPTGVAQVGVWLTAAAHATTATGVSYSYQWQADGVDISGATDDTFVPTATQTGKAIRVVVSYTAADGTTQITSITSAATSEVIPGVPTFTGIAQVGARLTADALPSGAQAYKWQVWNAASGGTSTDLGGCVTSLTRVLTATELGKYIGLNAYPDVNCTGAPSSSSRLGPVLAFTPTAVGAPTGVAAVGSRVQVNADSVTSVPGVTYSYQWWAGDGSILGATDDSILLTDGYAGRVISVTVTYRAADGTEITSIRSTATAPVAVFSPTTVGAPTGAAMEGSLLTVNPDSAPADPALTRSYQWQSTSPLGTVTNVGTNSPTYVATASDVDDTISVVVTYRNGSDVVATRTSTATAPVVAFAPTTIAAPTGVAQVGRTLTVAPHATTATGVTASYQWQANGVDISGATGNTYLLTGDESGKTVSVKVSYTSAGANVAFKVIPSAATGAVTPQTPTFTGTAQVGSELTAAPVAGGSSYQWLRWSAASGGTSELVGSCFTMSGSSTRVLTSAELGTFIALVAYSDVSCAGSSTSSTRSAQVTAFSPSAISAPTGAAMVGSRLTVAPDAATTVTGVTLSYQWRADGAVVGSNSSTYIIAAPASVDDTITVTVTYTAADGTAITSITSAPTGPVAAFAPTSIGPPSGAPMVGSRLSPPANATTLATGVTAHYQWKYQRGGNTYAINGADDDTYVITAPVAVGDSVLVEVTYKDANGTVLGTPLMGAPSDPVTAFSPTSIGPPSGTPMVGSRLSPPADAATSAVGVTATYVWTRTPPGGTPSPIPGATGSTYVLTPDDLDDSIAVTMTYFDANGNPLTSAVVGPVGVVSGSQTDSRWVVAKRVIASPKRMSAHAKPRDISSSTGTTTYLLSKSWTPTCVT